LCKLCAKQKVIGAKKGTTEWFVPSKFVPILCFFSPAVVASLLLDVDHHDDALLHPPWDGVKSIQCCG
jgi:hypothetical protein